MNRLASLPVRHPPLALAPIRSLAHLPGQEPVPPLPPPPLPPIGVPPPLDMPPQIPPEIREPDRPGEHLPISANPRLQPATRH